MSLWKIAWRSMQQRALASSLTALSMGLGVALVVAVLVIHSVVDQAFNRGVQGYDLIVGGKGGQWQLVLNSVFYLGDPIQQNVPYSYYEEFLHGRFSSAVKFAIPICTGHDFQGCQAVATVPDMFEKLTYLDGRKYEFAEGRNFKQESYFEAVVGSMAAAKAGLKVGETFEPVPTTAKQGRRDEHDHSTFTVVGVLAPTGTPNDRTIFMNIEGFFRCPAHRPKDSSVREYLGGSGEHEHLRREATAILVRTDVEANPQLAMALPDVINQGNVAQAVRPAGVIAELFDRIVGNVELLLLLLAVLVVVVAGIGILVSIYNSMSDRRHDIAVMRALGASRAIVMTVILMESILLSLGGGALGLVLGHGLVAAISPTIADQLGVPISALDFQWIELILIPGLTILATVVGFLPAVSAYRTDVAKSLTAAP